MIKVTLRMKYSLFILIISAGFLHGCTKNSQQDHDCSSDECLKQRAYDKVIAVHDKVMPRLAEISLLKEKIEAQIKVSDDSVVIADWRTLLVTLDNADKSMWDWMHQFNGDLADMSIDEAFAYLKQQQAKIDEVKEKVDGAIKQAEDMLRK